MKLWQNRERLVSVGLNVLIILLLFLVILQCGIFLNGTIKTNETEAGALFDPRLLSASAQEVTRSLDADLLLPAQIVISVGGDAHAVLNSAVVTTDLYTDLAPVLVSCLSEKPKTENEAFWNLTVCTPGVIYIRYHAAFPYQILHAFASASTGSDLRVRDASSVLVEEMCLRFVDGKVFAVVRGETGVYSFSGTTSLRAADFQGYVSLYSDVFYDCTLSAGAPSAVVTERIYAREIRVQKGIGAAITSDDARLEAWIRRFLFNPDKLNYHVEADGTAVYVESHGVLTCTDDRITYTASDDGGISVREFCAVRDEVDVYTYLRAASSWIAEVSAMDTAFTGGDAALRLSSVRTDGTALTLAFSLYADNLPLYERGGEPAFSMTFADGRVTEMIWNTVSVQRQLTKHAPFLESWSREALGTDDVHLAYCTDTDEPLLRVQWIAYRETEE